MKPKPLSICSYRYLSVNISFGISIYLSITPNSLYQSITSNSSYLSIYLSIYLIVCLPTGLPISSCTSTCLPMYVHLPVNLSLFISIYLSIYQAFLSTFLLSLFFIFSFFLKFSSNYASVFFNPYMIYMWPAGLIDPTCSSRSNNLCNPFHARIKTSSTLTVHRFDSFSTIALQWTLYPSQPLAPRSHNHPLLHRLELQFSSD